MPPEVTDLVRSVRPRVARRIVWLAIGGFFLVRGLQVSTPLVVLLGCAIIAGQVVLILFAAQGTRREHRAQVETGILTQQAPTYPVGALGDTVTSGRVVEPPKGYRATERRATIGSGREAFDRASAATLRWEVKTRAGFHVIRVGAHGAFSSDDPIAKGECAIVRFGPVRETVRVVRVIDEPRRKGFAYGTLPEHPLRGEEAFIVEWRDDETVELIVRSFSRPSTIYGWMAYPILLLAQNFFVRRYLRVLLE
jgi:uncharacterized protein (UPF0548 family)